jgi:predicted CXXCH cytochrome family protein
VEGSIPQVYHSSATNLAGGNFGYIDATVGGGAADTKGHNVICIDAAITGDANLSAPPGDEFTTGIASGAASPDFTCAGEKGCHGNRATADEAASISGAHHGDDSTIDGSTVAKSYRFLLGVKGAENNDATNPWENLSLAKHNEYQGADKGDTQDTNLGLTDPGDAGCISGLCGECHGTFHGTGASGMGTASGTWVRHPTDILLPNSAPYDAYDPTASYDATVPVAYTNPASPTRATAVVMCLSCHGVHGTDYPDILRWDYTAIEAGGGASTAACFRCHGDKDT